MWIVLNALLLRCLDKYCTDWRRLLICKVSIDSFVEYGEAYVCLSGY